MVEPKLRCAIYTRKSSEEGLEQDFNSLDAQREACAAFITSQRALGWIPIAQSFDDGGLSGGTLERPGLQKLLTEIQAGRVQVIVVYKVDRLTRSLADFAKLVELFDTHGVSFVSVTQQFNTTTSMGRLTLNVLLSFAQFEREVTGERIRDKIAASKKKGMWMGGLPPVGYLAQDRTLKIDEPQAERIRTIFSLYLQFNCVRKLKHALDQRGWKTPARNIKRKDATGNRPYTRGHLYRILTNPIYVGKIPHKDQVYDGNHPALIDTELWQAVQNRLEANRQGHKTQAKAAHPSLLIGKIYDDQGERLTPSHAQKGAQRYRYYIRQNNSSDPMRIPAHALEQTVIHSLADWLQDESNLLSLLTTEDAGTIRNCLKLAKEQATLIRVSPREHIDQWIEQVIIHPEKIEIRAQTQWLNTSKVAESGDTIKKSTFLIQVPIKLKRCGMAVKLIVNAHKRQDIQPDIKLINLIAKGQTWLTLLLSGQRMSIKAIADEAQVTNSYVTRVIKLALLAPDILECIAKGEQPPELTADQLIRQVPLPDDWQEQRSLLGFA